MTPPAPSRARSSSTLAATSGAIATDAAGNVYLANVYGIRKYDSSGACIAFCATPLNAHSPGFPSDAPNIGGLAVDRSSGEIFITSTTGTHTSNRTYVVAYDSTGALQSVIYGDLARGFTSLAARANPNGVFYAIDVGNQLIADVPLPPPGPVVIPALSWDGFNKADPIGNTSATLKAQVNPEGNATTYHFQYITAADYAANGNSFSGAHPATSTTEAPVGSDFAPYLLSSAIGCADPQVPPQPECLIPDTAYRARVVAADGAHTATGAAFTFTTRPPLELGESYSGDVGTATATLHGELNPLNIPATGRFQYVDDATYQADLGSGDGFQHAAEAPASGDPPLDFGDATDALTARSVQISGLDPDTAYRFRLQGSDPYATLNGPIGAFHTFAPLGPPATECPNQAFRAGTPSAALPDCRAYEMVSPLAKGGQDIFAPGVNSGAEGFFTEFPKARIDQARPDGSALTYSAYAAFADPPANTYSNQYLATRDPAAGWQSANITPPGDPPATLWDSGLPPEFDTHFQAFSDDLCAGFVLETSDTALGAGDHPGYNDLYRRDNCAGGGDLYQLLSLAAPSNQPVNFPAATAFGTRTQGFSADAQSAVFRANGALATSGVGASTAIGSDGKPINQLYLDNGGPSLRLISVMPGGSAASQNSSVGAPLGGPNRRSSAILAGAVSADARSVFWSGYSLTAASQPVSPKLYLRLNDDRAQSSLDGSGHCSAADRACTLAVSESVDPGAATFWAADPDATTALFSIDSGPHAGELYSYDVAKGIAYDPNPATLIGGGLVTLLGASPDAKSAYFLSTQNLAAGAAAGLRNLYLYRAGAPLRFIASLATSGETIDYRADSPATVAAPFRRLARVSADGSRLAFVANGPLTGYDSRDAQSAERDGEVYLYNADANGGAGQLHCVSCNPAGSRPAGRDVVNAGALHLWIASNIPGWETSLHPSRVLSADGNRLFFESIDALLPTDTNGAKDVYQWQAPDTGDCHSADPNYFPQNGGCLSLISSGVDPDDSEFIDASADGQDVFFTSRQKLWGGDLDTLIDVYDARVGGGFSVPVANIPCDLGAGACEGSPSSAVDTPGAGSAVFSGPGNGGANRGPKPKRCPRNKVKRHGRCVAKPHKHKSSPPKKRHHKRSHRRAHHNRGGSR